MRKTTTAIAALLAVQASTAAQPSDELQRMIEQPGLWRSFDWSNSRSNLAIRAPSWRLVEPENKPGEMVVPSYLQRSLTARGAVWSATFQPQIQNMSSDG